MVLIFKNKTQKHLTNEQAEQFAIVLQENKSKFVKFDGELYSVSDISGIVKDSRAFEIDMLNQGKYLCRKGNWHPKNEFCKCLKQNDYGEPQPTFKEEAGLQEDWNNLPSSNYARKLIDNHIIN